MSADAFEPIAEQLLVLFSHLFMCVPLHRAVLAQPERFADSPSKVRTSGSKVYWEAAAVIRWHRVCSAGLCLLLMACTRVLGAQQCG